MSEAEEMSRLARGLFTYLYEMPAKLAVATSLFEHPAAELSVDDSAQLCEDRRQHDHVA
jgi:hypothetical protein